MSRDLSATWNLFEKKIELVTVVSLEDEYGSWGSGEEVKADGPEVINIFCIFPDRVFSLQCHHEYTGQLLALHRLFVVIEIGESNTRPCYQRRMSDFKLFMLSRPKASDILPMPADISLANLTDLEESHGAATHSPSASPPPIPPRSFKTANGSR